MSHILATAGSNSSTSINFQLVQYTTSLVDSREIDLLELANQRFPMYGEDLEKDSGIPREITALQDRLQGASGLILSVNEHNGNPSAFFKNIMDWLSRADRHFLGGLPVLLMSASPGKRGAASSLSVVAQMIPKFGGRVVATFSLPGFKENFSREAGISDPDLKKEHQQALAAFLSGL